MQKVNKCTIALAVDSRQSLPQVSRLLPLAWGMSSTCQEQAPPGLGDVFNMSGAGCAGCQVPFFRGYCFKEELTNDVTQLLFTMSCKGSALYLA